MEKWTFEPLSRVVSVLGSVKAASSFIFLFSDLFYYLSAVSLNFTLNICQESME